MADAPILVGRDLRKAFGSRVLLDDVSLSIHDGERVGLVGINGSGKSTIAKILAGVDMPDGGDVAVRRDARVSYLPQEPCFEGAPTAREAALAGLEGWSEAMRRYEEATAHLESGAPDLDIEALVHAQADAAEELEHHGGFDLGRTATVMLTRLGIHDPEQLVTEMSGGERRRVALAGILVSEPTLAILDEPTNHLDADTVEWLEGYLANDFGGALILVTHDRYLLDAVCTRTLELDRGALHSFDGGWTEYLLTKSERLAHEARTEQNRQNFLRTEVEWLRRSPKARTTKQKARVARGEAALDANPQRRHEQVSGLSLTAQRTGKTILELHDLSVELGGRRLIDDLTLILRKGDRVGIVGPNGAGKTTLLRVALGQLAPVAGEVVVGQNTRFAYFDQNRSGLDDDLSVAENVAGDRDKVQIGDHTMPLVAWLGRFLFTADMQRKKLSALSGGERARVALAKLLLSPANLYLFDEPTNDLDVQTLGAVEEMLLEQNGTALVVTHDRYFLDRIATSILAFEGDGRVVHYIGDYTNYRKLRAAAEKARKNQAGQQGRKQHGAASEESPKSSPPSQAASSTQAGTKLTYGEEKELGGIFVKIEEADAEVARLEALLADPSLYAERGDEVPVLNDALDAARTTATNLVTRWEALEAKKGE